MNKTTQVDVAKLLEDGTKVLAAILDEALEATDDTVSDSAAKQGVWRPNIDNFPPNCA